MKEFSKVAGIVDIKPGEMRLFEAEGEQVVVANLGGAFVAFNNVCPHAACDLVYGELAGEEIECDCHGSRFNVRSGVVLSPPAVKPLTLYAVRIEGSDIFVGPS